MEEPPFAVVLTGVGERRMDVVQVLRTVTGLSAWHCARWCAAVPVPVVGATWFEAADRAAGRLRAAGAEADVVCGSCARTVPPQGRPLDPGPCAARAWSPADCPASRP
ncbi:ribosomal protein L7/L12 [Streptomyces sp. NPDC001118]|uniref:ribosomal protein L7/L12 n=1 Tax=unclassified Streptomyces TaxID=2593676 RepID=UPI00333322B3